MRTYDKEFKMNTVKLWESSGKSANQIAEELGIAKATLSRWIRDYRRDGNESFPGKGNIKSSEEEIRALKKELMHVREERDILKKAVAIFSGPCGKGTSL